MHDPVPQVDFVDCGDSALVFSTRFRIASPDDWLTAPTEFRFRIDEEFKKNGIGVTF